jgi:orotate phosphoribosyltransferase
MPKANGWIGTDFQNEKEFVALLEKWEVLLRHDHFVLRSGAHSSDFVNIKGLYPHTGVTKAFCKALAIRIRRELGPSGLATVRGVLAPAMGGVILCHDVAEWISLTSENIDREVLALFAEKDGAGNLQFNRGYDEYISGGNFVVVEDVSTTGGSIVQVIDLAHRHGGEVLLSCSIWDRGGTGELAGVPHVSLINRKLPIFTPEECAATGPCSKGIPINRKHGRGREMTPKPATG